MRAVGQESRSRYLQVVTPTETAVPVRMLIFVPVDALIELIRVRWRDGIPHKISYQAVTRNGRRRKVGEQLQCRWVQTGRGDFVSLKGCSGDGHPGGVEHARLRVKDDARLTGEVARAHGECWDGRRDLRGQPVAQFLEVRHEEQPVLAVEQLRNLDRTA